jgi:hypothetical protein
MEEEELRRLLVIYKSLITADVVYKMQRLQKEREIVEVTGVLEEYKDEGLGQIKEKDVEFFENKIIGMLKGNKI